MNKNRLILLAKVVLYVLVLWVAGFFIIAGIFSENNNLALIACGLLISISLLVGAKIIARAIKGR